jgi:hypothetical protein
VTDGKMLAMKGSAVTSLPRGTRRGQRPALRAETGPRSGNRRAGRAWINGREVGGTEGRFAHLDVGHD